MPVSKAFRDLANAHAAHGGPLGHYWRAVADEANGVEPELEPAAGAANLPAPVRDLLATACNYAAARRAAATAPKGADGEEARAAAKVQLLELCEAAVAFDESTGRLG